MPSFSTGSLHNLSGVNKGLQDVFNDVVREFDCTVTSGLRTTKEQKLLYAQGRTMPGPIVTNRDGIINLSNHQPVVGCVGNAVDVVPWPIDWTDKLRFYHFAGFVRGVAWKLGVDIEWGGDWDSDYILNDQDFYDLPHWQTRQ